MPLCIRLYLVCSVTGTVPEKLSKYVGVEGPLQSKIYIVCNNSPMDNQPMYIHSYVTFKILKKIPACFDPHWDYHQRIHDCVSYLPYPDVLSPVGEHLSGDAWGSWNPISF
jgi:hypothetical protein